MSGHSAEKGLPDPADQRLFVVSDEAFDAFMERLDRPAEMKPQLAELLGRQSMFDVCGCPAGLNPAHDCDLVQDVIRTRPLPPAETDTPLTERAARAVADLFIADAERRGLTRPLPPGAPS